MRLQSLHLQHYRNVADLSLRFDGSVVGFLGKNAQGKTNLLESIYALSHGESWRSHADSDLIAFDSTFCRIDSEVEETTLSLVVERIAESHLAKKSYLVNGVRRRKDTFTSHFSAILFHPEELDVVTGSPSSRRTLLDTTIIQAFPEYAHALLQYGKVMTSRNRLLEHIREGTAERDQIEYWNSMLVSQGTEIYLFRYRFFAYVSTLSDSYVFDYLPKIDVPYTFDDELFRTQMKEIFYRRINDNLFKEIQSATTQYGPHKDDFVFNKEGKSLALYGSRGEQRAGVFAFKKIQLQYIQHIRAVTPVLLLDDIFSEFDIDHRTKLSELIQGYQTFITGTESSFFKAEGVHFDQIYTVSSGTIS